MQLILNPSCVLHKCNKLSTYFFYFSEKENKDLIETVLFDQGALQEYVIICCQAIPGGGFIDKPGK